MEQTIFSTSSPRAKKKRKKKKKTKKDRQTNRQADRHRLELGHFTRIVV